VLASLQQHRSSKLQAEPTLRSFSIHGTAAAAAAETVLKLLWAPLCLHHQLPSCILLLSCCLECCVGHTVWDLIKLPSQTDIAACFCRDLREGLKQASRAAEKYHTEQPGPDQHQLQSDDRQQDCLPSITLSVSPRQSQQSSQGIVAADNSKLTGLPMLRATSPPQLLSWSAAADRITVGASQLRLQRASALGQQESFMPLAGADPSMAQAMTCALDQRGHQSHIDEGEQPQNIVHVFPLSTFTHDCNTTCILYWLPSLGASTHNLQLISLH